MLTKTDEYAIRALLRLASYPRGRYVLAVDLARETCVPPPFLGRILGNLARQGILESKRGASGGFRFSRNPGAITLRHIFSTTGSVESYRRCQLCGGDFELSDSSMCPLHQFCLEYNKCFFDLIGDKSLSDLAEAGKATGYLQPREA